MTPRKSLEELSIIELLWRDLGYLPQHNERSEGKHAVERGQRGLAVGKNMATDVIIYP